jgi:hypothetical protein
LFDVGKRVGTARTISALAVGAVAIFAVNRYFARFPLTGVGSVLIGLLSVITLRSMVRSGQIRNPSGSDERDFGLKPVWGDLMRAVVCIVMGFALVAAYALAVRYDRLPDGVSTALFIAFPGLLILLLGFWFLVRSSYKAVCGVAKR